MRAPSHRLRFLAGVALGAALGAWLARGFLEDARGDVALEREDRKAVVALQALASALDRALRLDAERRAALAETAIQHVQERFTRDSMCAATLEVYREVLADTEVARWKSGKSGR